MGRAIQAILQPHARQLRQFAVSLPLAATLLCWLWSRDIAVAASLGCASALLAAVAWFWPPLIKPLYLGLLILGLPIGWLIGELVMLTVYFGLITPLACWFRLRQRDTIHLKQDQPVQSYWQTRRHDSEPASYLRRW